MSKKRVRESIDHNEIVDYLKRNGDQNDLIQFMEGAKPRVPPREGDEWKDFERSVYNLMLSAWRIRKKDKTKWRLVDGIIRDAAVAVVEMQ